MKSSDSSSEILSFGTPLNNYESLFNVVLVEPEIPQNTGNIGRTCVGLQCDLHIVGTTGFSITDKNLKRAGLDYWQHLRWRQHKSIEDWESQVADKSRVFLFSAFAEKSYFDVEYRKGDSLVFGKETKGLPEHLMQRHPGQCLVIPMPGPVRGYNVATAAAIVLMEAYRQVLNKHS